MNKANKCHFSEEGWMICSCGSDELILCCDICNDHYCLVCGLAFWPDEYWSNEKENEMIVIVGVGALGSHLTLFARNWKGPLRIVDFDKVEQKNTQSQFHSKMGLRRNKAQAIQQSLQGLFGVKVDIIPHKLTDDNTDALLSGASLVIDCTDNAAARQTIQKFVRANNIPCLHGCLDAAGEFGRVVWDEYFVADVEGQEGQATCEDGEALPFFALVAAQTAVIAQKFLDSGEKRSVQISPVGIMRLA